MNPWETETIGYSIRTFYTRAKDKQGHSTQINLKVPDYVAAELSRIVQSKEIPEYQTVQDIIRDAIIHRLRWLEDNVGNLRLSESTRALIDMEASLSRVKEAESLSEMIARIRDSCEKFFTLQDYDALSDFIDQQKEIVFSIREPYRQRMLKILDEYEGRIRK